MKFAALSLSLLSSFAFGIHEAELIESRKGERIHHGDVKEGLCHNKPIDANMLIARYGLNVTDPDHASAIAQAVNGNLLLGSITQLIPEANDAGRVGALVVDGLSGDVRFPHGDIKPLLTVGEINQCEENHGDVYVGVPDGMGAYLVDDDTVRIVVQSESYGPLRYESYPYYVNRNGASFTGSHVQYADFDRELLADFMTHRGPASDMIKGFGQVARTYYNLAGQLVGNRNPHGPTVYGAHFSNTDVEGNYVVAKGAPTEADWLMQSLCSAHLEEAHQWGEGIGFEDDIYITNEEWIDYVDGKEFVGISMHAIDLANGVDYAVGSVTVSGFEKIVELNSKHKDYVVLALSGYNGPYAGDSAELAGRNAEYGPRPDGSDYVRTENIHPSRIYVGMKGKMEDGSDAPADDFLARNGLRYGKVYGFAVDMSENGPTGGLFRDAYHKNRENGSLVSGKFVAIDWQWDGTVKNFRHDGAWEFQIPVPGHHGTNMMWWNANGYDSAGAKTEHISPDTRPGVTGFIQGSTAGYFGHYYIHDITEALNNAEDFPSDLKSSYYVYQGENDITGQIELSGDGLYNLVEQCNNNNDATKNCDGSVKSTFEDVDGLEIIAAADGLYAVIQEDSGNRLGERMFISSRLEHDKDGEELTYYFMAMSGGSFNTRMAGHVGIPATTNDGSGAHEFSGIIDLSGMLAKEDDRRMRVNSGKEAKAGNKSAKSGRFMIKAHDGAAKREAEHMVPINDKLIALGLQAHNMDSGVIKALKADRGGQVLLYQPSI